MVLEDIINPIKAEKTPGLMVIIGFLYTSVAIAMSLWIFRAYASMIFVFLIALACIPLVYATFRFEEEKDLKDLSEKALLKEHGKALGFLMYLFLGFSLACVLWYTVLPSATVSTLFQSQIGTINNINGGITGLFTADQLNLFTKIFLNNIKVMIFCLIFSLLYGAGAIFILAWNASVIGAAVGNYIRGNLASYAHLVGLDKTGQYFQVIGVGLFKYVIHGVPEILAYFTAGLGGGIISIAIIKHDFGTQKFEHILLDSADLILASIGLIFLAAALEVWVTPIFF
jgi:uncharacterized membrane protein SpoIIM required for sporulation